MRIQHASIAELIVGLIFLVSTFEITKAEEAVAPDGYLHQVGKRIGFTTDKFSVADPDIFRRFAVLNG